MGKIAVFLLLLINGFYSLAKPWFGITIGYLFNILGPQYIWWWNFQGLRAFYLVAVPTIAGFCISSVRGAINFDIIKNKRVLFASLFFILIFLSYFWGPYVDVINKWRFFEPYQVLIRMIKIFVFFFIGLCCISDENKMKIFALILPISALYLIYWANMQYLSGRFFIRLQGPLDILGCGLYSDENNFAMLFVVSIPFLFFLGWFFKQWYLRWSLWLAIPFAWHAIFLTGSRGGLLGAAFVSLFAGLRSQKKIIGVMLIPLFIFAFIWQGGSVIKERAETIIKRSEDSSQQTPLDPRIEAWKAGLKMIIAYPITGIGLASFGQAYLYFMEGRPKVAHNTFIQIAAESGIPACFFYVLLMLNCMNSLLKNRDLFGKESFGYYLSDATLISLGGFLVCSLFLTLTGFEIQFYLIILANTLNYLARKRFIDEKNT